MLTGTAGTSGGERRQVVVAVLIGFGAGATSDVLSRPDGCSSAGMSGNSSVFGRGGKDHIVGKICSVMFAVFCHRSVKSRS